MRPTMRAAAAGTALVLTAASGAAWADEAAVWLDGRGSEPRHARDQRSQAAPTAVLARATLPFRPRTPEPRTTPAAAGDSLDWERIVRSVEERHAPSPARHPVDGPSDYGEAGAEFGAPRPGHVHEGQDVFAPAGTSLVAVRDGVVVDAGADGGRGNYIAIYSREADETYVYFHMLAPAEASPGERIQAGGKVGELGCTGSCYGDHLHFEVRAGEGVEAPAIDPLPLLERLSR